jgi:H2-forming N5,N10-methylenetetrahydromethanopterin dehydrogenase-like enzyme
MADSAKKSYLRKTSRKAPALKNNVIARRMAGEPKSKIARDLGMSVNTVASIIELSDIDKMLQSGQVESHRLIPKSISVVSNKLDVNDLDAAKFILSNTVFAERGNHKVSSPDTTINTALSVYVSTNDKVDEPVKVITTKSE